MGASLTMIDRHYGHLACDGREHAINLLDGYSTSSNTDVHHVDAAWTPNRPAAVIRGNRNAQWQPKPKAL